MAIQRVKLPNGEYGYRFGDTGNVYPTIKGALRQERLQLTAKEEVVKFNPYHDEKGRFASRGKDAYKGGVLTQWAKDHIHITKTPDQIERETLTPVEYARLQEIKKEMNDAVKNGEITAEKYKKNGVWTPERKKVHAKIIREYLKDLKKYSVPNGIATAIFLGGRGGSGKSSFEAGGKNSLDKFDPSKFLKLDSDEVKKMLPGYDPAKAFLFHKESSYILGKLINIAKKANANVVLDMTFKDADDTLVKSFKDLGYKLEGYFMHVPPEVSAKRALKRWAGEGMKGRLVPTDVVLAMKDNEKNFDRVTKYFDNWEMYSNTGSSPKLEISNGKAIKSDSSISLFEVLKYNPNHDEKGRFTTYGGSVNYVEGGEKAVKQHLAKLQEHISQFSKLENKKGKASVGRKGLITYFARQAIAFGADVKTVKEMLKGVDRSDSWKGLSNFHAQIKQAAYIDALKSGKPSLVAATEKLHGKKGDKKTIEAGEKMAKAAIESGKNSLGGLDSVVSPVTTEFKPVPYNDMLEFNLVKALKDLDTGSKDALYNYSNTDYKPINKYLIYGDDYAFGSNAESLKKKISKIDRALDRPLGVDVVLTRHALSVNISKNLGLEYALDVMNIEELKTLVGKTYTEKGYSSTTLKKSSISAASTKSTKVIIRIEAPKNTKGLYISPISEFPSEEEVLLPRNTTFVIKSIEKKRDSYGEYRFNMTVGVVNQAPVPLD